MTKDAGNEAERMVLTRVFEAPREVVWRAWTEPRYAAQWWGPKGCTMPVCRMDVRVGGRFLMCMRMPDGQEFWSGGEYHEIVPGERIVFSMYFADAEGNKVTPESYGIEHESIEGARDTVLFADAGEGRTRLTFLGNEAMESARESGQVEGMEQSLEKLAGVVAGLVG